MNDRFKLRAVAAAVSMTLAGAALASSHREAPFITNLPKVDASDFYMFNSYEAGRTGFVTLVANYLPLQEPQGGPNYFQLDPQALYEIHVDNNGDGAEDLTFQFRFTRTTQGLAVMAGGKVDPGSFDQHRSGQCVRQQRAERSRKLQPDAGQRRSAPRHGGSGRRCK